MITLEEIVDRPPVYLGNKEFIFEVKKVFSETPTWNLIELESQLSKKQYGHYPYINGGMQLLRFSGVVLGSSNNLHMMNNIRSGERLYEDVACKLINTLHETNDFIKVFPAGSISIDIDSQDICLIRNLMDFKYAPVWNLLRDILSIRQGDSFEKIYLTNTDALMRAFSLNTVEKSKLISQRDLKEILRRQSLAGAKAERAALEYEKRRLCQRSDLFYVRIISDYNVNAGYDIISFNDNMSKSLDRFIEVKSFVASKPQFYWSNNEIEMAKKYGDKYFIYLVDRFEMNDDNFSPIIIQNPVKNVLESINWKIFPDGLLCRAAS